MSKKFEITIAMHDSAPEGSALLEALGELVKNSTGIVDNDEFYIMGEEYDEFASITCKLIKEANVYPSRNA